MAPLEVVPWLVICIAMDVISEGAFGKGTYPR